MKKLTLFIAIIMIAFAGQVAAQTKKVAVVTFYADKQVDLSDVGMTTVSVITDLMNDPTFNLQPLVEKYHDRFFSEYAPKFPFQLVPESEVTGNPAYQAFKGEFQGGYNPSRYVTAKGYVPVDHNWGKNNEKNLLKLFPDVDGIMFVYISFSMNKGFGVGGTATTKMQAYTNIVVYNKKGEKVFTINEHANSKKTGMIVGGVPTTSPDKILPMCEDALNQLMEDLDKRIQKIIDKSAKKL